MSVTLPARLQELSPRDLPVLRQERYRGDGFSLKLQSFAEEDRRVLTEVYRQLRLIYDIWLYMGNAPDSSTLEELLLCEGPRTSTVRTLGRSTQAQPTGGAADEQARMKQVLHDLRGGGLTPLLGYLEMLGDPEEEFRSDDLRRCISLAGDHAKVMRNAVTDLDPWILRSDRLVSLRDVSQDVQKWSETEFHVPRGVVRVQAAASGGGFLSDRGSEAAAVDRVLSNLMNNAARFSSDLRIHLQVERTGNLFRFTVENRIDEDQARWLAANSGSQCRELFQSGVTRDSSGLGLRNCAELVSRCFGLARPEQAVDGGYLGAAAEEERFTSWFHWPVFEPT